MSLPSHGRCSPVGCKHPNSPGHKADLLRKLEDNLKDLYAAILEFQVSAMNYLGKRSAVRLLGDAFDIEGWSSILQGIKDRETRTDKDGDAQMKKVDQRLKTIQSTEELERARRIVTEHDKMARKLLRILYTCPYKD